MSTRPEESPKCLAAGKNNDRMPRPNFAGHDAGDTHLVERSKSENLGTGVEILVLVEPWTNLAGLCQSLQTPHL
jgi:hypothetical protein